MNSLAAVDYYVLIFYAVLLVGVGLYFAKFVKGAREFFTGGNMIPWWVAGISLYMSSFSAWTFTGAAGFIYFTGGFGIIYFFTWSLAYLIGHRITAARWRRSRVMSPIEYTSTRYNVTTQQLVGYVMVLSGLLSRGITLTAVAKVISSTIQVNIDYVILIAGIVVLLYTLLGGLWAVTIADVVQFIILLAITLIVMPISIKVVGGMGTFLQNLPELKMEHVYSGMKYDVHYLVAITLINIMSSNWGAAQRYYSVKDEKDAKRVGLTTGLLFLTAPILFGIPPLAARILWPDLSTVPFFANVFKPEDLVYLGIVMKTIPNGLIGFFLAAMFSATLSTIDTTMNVDSSVISRDLYGGLVNPHATDKQILRAGKISTVILGVVTIVTAMIYARSELGIFNLMVIFIALLHMPVAIPMVFGLVFKKLPRWSAASAISLGLLISVTAKFVLGWTVGPHIYVTTVTTFAILLLSPTLSRQYRRNRLLCAAMILAWTLIEFLLLYATSSLSASRTILLAMAAAVFAAGLLFFSRLFANESQNDREVVDKFFHHLSIPVDIRKEVYATGRKEVSTFPIVGVFTMVIGLFILLLMLGPVAKNDWVIFVWMGALLLIIGFLLYYFGGRRERRFVEGLLQADKECGEASIWQVREEMQKSNSKI